MEVKDVLKRLKELGLDVRTENRTGSHHKIYSKNGVWLFDVATSPSDPNWHYNIARNLRRLGLSLKESKTMPRLNEIRERLEAFLDENHDELKMQAKQYNEYSVRRQFSRLGLQYADEHGMPAWKNLSSGEQVIGRLLTKNEGISRFASELIEATMDWFEQTKAVEPQSLRVDEEEEKSITSFTEELPITVELDSNLKQRYANALLNLLEMGIDDPQALEQILNRLDKLVS